VLVVWANAGAARTASATKVTIFMLVLL